MFNVGITELIVLGIIGLLVLGPEQLPEVARKLATIFNELKRAKDEIMSPVEDLKADAQRMLQQARESAAQKELEELLHKIDPSKLENYNPLKPNDPASPPAPEHAAGHVADPAQQELALDQAGDVNDPTNAGKKNV